VSVATAADYWLDRLTKVTDSTAREALSVSSGCVSTPSAPTFIQDMSGSYLALISDDVQMQLGIAASSKGCKALAGSLLMMEPNDPDLDETVIADALGEIVNILAGLLKEDVTPEYPNLSLGLPTVIHGHLAASESQELSVRAVQIGDIPCLLITLVNKPH